MNTTRLGNFTVMALKVKSGVDENQIPPQIQIVRNCANQIVLFDGKSTVEHMKWFAGFCRQYFERVDVFRGANIGHLTDL